MIYPYCPKGANVMMKKKEEEEEEEKKIESVSSKNAKERKTLRTVYLVFSKSVITQNQNNFA